MDPKSVSAGRTAMFLLGATLALGFTFSAYLIGRAAVRVTQPNHIFVKGSAVKTVRSDFGIWTGSFSTRAKELSAGYHKLNEDQKKISSFLEKQGFKKNEFVYNSISITTNMKRDAKGNLTSIVEDYTLKQTVTVSSAKVDALEKASREFTYLVRDNVFVRSHEANYVIGNLDRYKMELLSEAARNAVERAKVLAGESGGKVGGLVSARQGVFQITPPASSASSDVGEYDKTTIVKEIKAVVTLQFKVE